MNICDMVFILVVVVVVFVRIDILSLSILATPVDGASCCWATTNLKSKSKSVPARIKTACKTAFVGQPSLCFFFTQQTIHDDCRQLPTSLLLSSIVDYRQEDGSDVVGSVVPDPQQQEQEADTEKNTHISSDNNNNNNNIIPLYIESISMMPLPEHTFAGMVEHALLDRFADNDIQRVLQSWRLLEHGYEHHHHIYVGNRTHVDNGRVVDNTEEGYKNSMMMYQQCHSYIPGLSIHPFWNPNDFDWCSYLTMQYPSILREFEQVTHNMEELQRRGNIIWAGALTHDAGSYGEGWKTLVLMDRGYWDPVNVNLFPTAAKAVHQSGVPAVEVFFASMQPSTSIKPHTDFTNFVLTSHLALQIPQSGQNVCRLTVGDETRQWINGQVLVFDTSLMHEAVNDSPDETRYILMLRLWHPDLTETERQALMFTYDCLEFPELVTGSPEDRLKIEHKVQMMRSFPQIIRGTDRGSVGTKGFGSSAASRGSKKKKK